MPREPTPYRIARVDEFPAGTRRSVDLGGRSIGVLNVAGTSYAVRNQCPHQQAPLCAGPVSDTTLPSAPGTYAFGLEGRVLRCPWRGWEFDLATGRSLFDANRCRVRAYPVTVEATGRASAAKAPVAHVERFDVTIEGAHVVAHA